MRQLELGFLTLVVTLQSLQITLAQQVVHIESRRLLSEEPGWYGSVDLDWEWIHNRGDIFTFENAVQIEYVADPHVFLLLNEVNLLQVENDNAVYDGFQHIRYNYRLERRLVWEAFLQTQFNEVYRVAFRGLAGTGPRFGILDRHQFLLFIGSLYMYEYQRITDVEQVQLSHRISNYVSASWFPAEDIGFHLINYFQPKISDFKDYRVSGELVADFAFRQWLSFRIGGSYFYDVFPAEDVPREYYSVTNGIRIRF